LPKRPSQKVVTYSMRMGDERILAPLAVFFPDMFGLQGEQLFHKSEKFTSDPTDPNDDDYLERTMTRHELVCSSVSKYRDMNWYFLWSLVSRHELVCSSVSKYQDMNWYFLWSPSPC